MTKLETYSTVLIGIVLGMAVARIVGFFGNVLVRAKHSMITLSHGVWLVGLLLLIIQSWWAMQSDWDFNNVNSLWKITFLLVSPILLYFASAVLCPDLPDRKTDFDVATHHVSVRNIFFFTLGVLFIVFIPEAMLMSRCPIGLLDRDNVMRVAAASTFFAAPLLIKIRKEFDLVMPIMVVALLAMQLLWAGPILEGARCD